MWAAVVVGGNRGEELSCWLRHSPSSSGSAPLTLEGCIHSFKVGFVILCGSISDLTRTCKPKVQIPLG